MNRYISSIYYETDFGEEEENNVEYFIENTSFKYLDKNFYCRQCDKKVILIDNLFVHNSNSTCNNPSIIYHKIIHKNNDLEYVFLFFICVVAYLI